MRSFGKAVLRAATMAGGAFGAWQVVKWWWRFSRDFDGLTSWTYSPEEWERRRRIHERRARRMGEESGEHDT